MRKPKRLFPQSMPKLTKRPWAARGIPAPIIDLKKSLEASTEAAYSGYATSHQHMVHYGQRIILTMREIREEGHEPVVSVSSSLYAECQ